MMRLEDLYEIVRQVGRGGYGRVLLVRDRTTKQFHAAKILANPDDRQARVRFTREVKQLIRYQPFRRVVRITQAYLGAEIPFFIMPYAEDGAITQWAGKLDQEQVLTVMKQLLEPVAQIHAGGGFHRDIKPDNILVINRITALADFGLGNAPDCTVNFTIGGYGTPGYMAPEMFQGGAFSAEADVFSAGATWFHLITGKRPPPKGFASLDPQTIKPRTPFWIADLILAMTAPVPERRPSAAAVYRQLHNAKVKEKPLPKKSDDLIAAVVLGGLALWGLASL